MNLSVDYAVSLVQILYSVTIIISYLTKDLYLPRALDPTTIMNYLIIKDRISFHCNNYYFLIE